MTAFYFLCRQDMKPFGVNVSCIEPGLFKTGLSDRDMVMRQKMAVWDTLPQTIQKQYGEKYLKEGKP